MITETHYAGNTRHHIYCCMFGSSHADGTNPELCQETIEMKSNPALGLGAKDCAPTQDWMMSPPGPTQDDMANTRLVFMRTFAGKLSEAEARVKFDHEYVCMAIDLGSDGELAVFLKLRNEDLRQEFATCEPDCHQFG